MRPVPPLRIASLIFVLSAPAGAALAQQPATHGMLLVAAPGTAAPASAPVAPLRIAPPAGKAAPALPVQCAPGKDGTRDTNCVPGNDAESAQLTAMTGGTPVSAEEGISSERRMFDFIAPSVPVFIATFARTWGGSGGPFGSSSIGGGGSGPILPPAVCFK